MDRVRRTLCLASKAIAVSAICLTSSFVSAENANPQRSSVTEGRSVIRQVAASGNSQAVKPGLLQAFASTSNQGSSSSDTSGGLLGTWFGATSSSSTKSSASKTGNQRTTKASVTANTPSKSTSTTSRPVSTRRVTTQDSKADWSGVPFHNPKSMSATQGLVPLSDPDPNAKTPAARSSEAVNNITLPKVPVPPRTLPATPANVAAAVEVMGLQGTAGEATAEPTSSRRSSRRTAASFLNNEKTSARNPSKTTSEPAETSSDDVADLVPKVARKPVTSAEEKQPIDQKLSTSEPSKSLEKKVEPSTPATEGSKSDDLEPLPPATLPAEDGQEAEEDSLPSSSTERDSESLPVTAASHRPDSENISAESNESTTADTSDDSSELSSAEVESTNDAPVEQSVAMPEEQPAAISERLPSTSETLSANDLRGQPIAAEGTNAGFGSSKTMQLSPPTTPDFGVNAKPDDASNQMRGQPGGVGKITNTSSELPGIRVTTKGPESILIRQNAEYVILVENRGEIDADGVLIRALVPEWADLRSQFATRGEIASIKEGSSNRLVWDIGKLPAGESETMKLQLIASRSGNYDLDIDWTLVPQKSVARVQVREPRLNLSIEGPEQVVFGESQTYKVRLLNPGNGTASNVTFTLSPKSATPQTQKIGDIPPGKEAQFDIELTAKDHGDLQIHGLAAGDFSLRAEAEKIIKVSSAKLEAVLTGPQVKYQNTEGLYSLQVQNHGDAPSESVQASLRLPSGVKYLGGIEGAVQQDQVLRWDLQEVAPGAIRTYQFACNMTATGEHLFSFDCRGTAAGAAAVSIATRVESIADLVLTVSDPVAPAPIATDVPYEIVIRNRGSKEATDVRAIAQFSHGVEPIRIEGQSGEVMTGQVLFDPIPRIGAGEEVRVRVIAQADRPGHHRFRAEIRSGDTVLVAEEATHYMSPDGERVSRRSSERLRR